MPWKLMVGACAIGAGGEPGARGITGDIWVTGGVGKFDFANGAVADWLMRYWPGLTTGSTGCVVGERGVVGALGTGECSGS